MTYGIRVLCISPPAGRCSKGAYNSREICSFAAFNAQFSNDWDVDTKAAKTSRLDALLLGLVLTAGSFLAQADAFSAGVYVNGFSLAGLLFVVGSFTLAVATYSTTDVRTGVGPADVQRLVGAKYSEREWLVLLLRSEARWMAENERRQARNASLLTASQAALIVGTTLLTAGVAAVHW